MNSGIQMNVELRTSNAERRSTGNPASDFFTNSPFAGLRSEFSVRRSTFSVRVLSPTKNGKGTLSILEGFHGL
jgi:hypothetical protein